MYLFVYFICCALFSTQAYWAETSVGLRGYQPGVGEGRVDWVGIRGYYSHAAVSGGPGQHEGAPAGPIVWPAPGEAPHSTTHYTAL